ncbi:hypothetical protein [Pantoea ananatis]|uniref:hypothetical protein n=1 Tax=Pantoea ananas TaxID=553 RepID=UPI001FF0978F|nr:hypothetical protein [Pantoea ananatis]
MKKEPKYLFAKVRQPCDYRPNVTAIVLFGLKVMGDDETVYLEIRFIDYDSLQVEGDHMMFSLEEALKFALIDYGIEELDWREMSQQEINRIEW